jgi:hypothetical protein
MAARRLFESIKTWRLYRQLALSQNHQKAHHHVTCARIYRFNQGRSIVLAERVFVDDALTKSLRMKVQFMSLIS